MRVDVSPSLVEPHQPRCGLPGKSIHCLNVTQVRVLCEMFEHRPYEFARHILNRRIAQADHIMRTFATDSGQIGQHASEGRQAGVDVPHVVADRLSFPHFLPSSTMVALWTAPQHSSFFRQLRVVTGEGGASHRTIGHPTRVADTLPIN
ncbi:hypothetical protein TRVL_09648 [Trypanosoma vivax]|nr:hypothetical protein TRVL_09648 [Trypanosoma vivax]